MSTKISSSPVQVSRVRIDLKPRGFPTQQPVRRINNQILGVKGLTVCGHIFKLNERSGSLVHG